MAYDPIADGEAREKWENARRLNPRLQVGQKDEPVKNVQPKGPNFAGQTGGCALAALLLSPLGWLGMIAVIAAVVLILGGG